MEVTGSLRVVWDVSYGLDSDYLVVSKLKLGRVAEFIDTLEGEEARELYLKLTTRKGKTLMDKTGSVIVSWDFPHGTDNDMGILLVGKKMPGRDVEIINAFQGEEAKELYLKLTTRKEK